MFTKLLSIYTHNVCNLCNGYFFLRWFVVIYALLGDKILITKPCLCKKKRETNIMYGIFPFLSEAYICGRLQSKSECRMEAIFLEGLFVEQIGAVVDRTVPRPPPTIPRCFAIFLQHLQCFHNIFTMWCKKIHSEVPFQGHQHSSSAVVLPFGEKELHPRSNISLLCTFSFQLL